MNSSNIYHINSIKQDAKEGKITMQGIALTRLVHQIIRDYGKYDGCDYSVNLADINNTDRKMIISHVFDSAGLCACL